MNMNLAQLQALRKVVGDMRFIQASALVASGTSEGKDARRYMNELAALEEVINEEMSIRCAKSVTDALWPETANKP